MPLLPLLLGLAAQAPAPDAEAVSPPSPVQGADVDWRNDPPSLRRVPSVKDVTLFFPKAAIAARVSGRVTISCIAERTGKLRDCAVAAEEPAGYGFGAASLKLAPYFQLWPTTKSGRSVEGMKIAFPVSFKQR